MTTHPKLSSGLLLISALALMPVLGIFFPRFYAFAPGLIGVFGAAFSWFLYKTKPAISKNTLIFPALIWLLALASILWSVNPEISIERVQKLLMVLLPGTVFLSYIQTKKPEDLKRYMPLIALGLGTGALLSSFDIHAGNPLYKFTHSIPETQSFGDSVYNRGSVAITLCLIPTWFMLKRTLKNLYIRAGFILAIATMLLSGESQSAQLALAAGLLTYWLFPYRRKFAWYGLIALLTLLIFATPLITTYIFSHFAETLNELPFLGKGSGYAGGRTEIWNFVSTRAMENPLYGYGIEATKAIKDFDSDTLYHEANHVLHPHNFAVQFWIEFGALGAAIASALLGYLLLLIKRLELAGQRIALPTFMTTLTIAATGYGFWQSWWLGLLFMVAGLCMLATRLESEQ